MLIGVVFDLVVEGWSWKGNSGRSESISMWLRMSFGEQALHAFMRGYSEARF